MVLTSLIGIKRAIGNRGRMLPTTNAENSSGQELHSTTNPSTCQFNPPHSPVLRGNSERHSLIVAVCQTVRVEWFLAILVAADLSRKGPETK